MFDMKQLNVDILAGGLKIQKKTLEPFNDEICRFLISFSQKLISSREARKFTDLIALAFWSSKKNILYLKKKFSWIGRIQNLITAKFIISKKLISG